MILPTVKCFRRWIPRLVAILIVLVVRVLWVGVRVSPFVVIGVRVRARIWGAVLRVIVLRCCIVLRIGDGLRRGVDAPRQQLREAEDLPLASA